MNAIASQIIKSITQTRIDHILGSEEDALELPEVSANEFCSRRIVEKGRIN